MEFVAKRLFGRWIDSCPDVYNALQNWPNSTINSLYSIEFNLVCVVWARVCGKAWNGTIIVIMLIVVRAWKRDRLYDDNQHWKNTLQIVKLGFFNSSCSCMCVSSLVAVNRIVPEEYAAVIVENSLGGSKSLSRAELAKTTSRRPSFLLVLSCYTLSSTVY